MDSSLSTRKGVLQLELPTFESRVLLETLDDTKKTLLVLIRSDGLGPRVSTSF